MRVLDINAGIGGMAIGFGQAGHEIVSLYEEDPISVQILMENFGCVNNVIPLDAAKIPHPDIVCGTLTEKVKAHLQRLLPVIQPRIIMFRVPRTVNCSFLSALGYQISTDNMQAFDFGVPQFRTEKYLVGFRKDMHTLFTSFPFPDSWRERVMLGSILELSPDQSLKVSGSMSSYFERRDKEASSRGVRFKTKTFKPTDVLPHLSASVSKGEHPLVEDDGVIRRLSKLEVARAMSFPDDFKLSFPYRISVSRLCTEPCPKVVTILAEELKDWM